MRRRLSYANVTATLALVFAMSGGAMAANSYLINSTKQINPKVLKKLTGKPGKNGTAGANGATGATGPQGKEGSAGKEGLQGKEGKEGIPGPFPSTLPSGETETGTFALAGGTPTAGGWLLFGGISFPLPLTFTPTVQIIESGAPVPTGCSGSAASPGAASGHLCIFQGYTENASGLSEFEPVAGEHTGFKLGVSLFASSTGSGNADLSGTWAVTAP
jgi:hypothetical protein